MPRMNPTPWKKSRTFGDIYGGRLRRRMTDNIFKRLHSLTRPGPQDELPFLIDENPSRDFYFPLSAAEALEVLNGVSSSQLAGITHIWMRRDKRSSRHSPNLPLAEFICGSGVRVIVIYPWRCDLLLPLGDSKPTQKMLRPLEALNAEVFESNRQWFARFTEPTIRQYCIQHLLLHGFAYHIDCYNRHWSKANHKQIEDFANQYAVRWSSDAVKILNNLDSEK
jgi:hypothetical protein